jgi:hypothetical protein
MFGRPGVSEHWRVDGSPSGGEARGDEEKMEPSVHVLDSKSRLCGKL